MVKEWALQNTVVKIMVKGPGLKENRKEELIMKRL